MILHIHTQIHDTHTFRHINLQRTLTQIVDTHTKSTFFFHFLLGVTSFSFCFFSLFDFSFHSKTMKPVCDHGLLMDCDDEQRERNSRCTLYTRPDREHKQPPPKSWRHNTHKTHPNHGDKKSQTVHTPHTHIQFLGTNEHAKTATYNSKHNTNRAHTHIHPNHGQISTNTQQPTHSMDAPSDHRTSSP